MSGQQLKVDWSTATISDREISVEVAHLAIDRDRHAIETGRSRVVVGGVPPGKEAETFCSFVAAISETRRSGEDGERSVVRLGDLEQLSRAPLPDVAELD